MQCDPRTRTDRIRAGMTYSHVTDGTRLRTCVRRGGDRQVVLVHGWRQSHRLFDGVIAQLGKDVTVLAYDQRGMGESDKPDDTYAFTRMGQDLLDLLEVHGFDDCTVLGWSMGCTTALSAAAIETSRISRIILMNGPLRLTRTSDFPYALSDEELAGYVEGLETGWPRHESGFFRDSLLPENAELAGLLEYVGRQTPLDIGLRLVRAQADVDHRGTVERLDVPILAAYSRRDPYWPLGLAEWIAEHARHGSMTTFEHSAHCAPIEEPASVCQVVKDFAR
jgi:pimeloyl-ACP methyl ester carboxylesterase